MLVVLTVPSSASGELVATYLEVGHYLAKGISKDVFATLDGFLALLTTLRGLQAVQ